MHEYTWVWSNTRTRVLTINSLPPRDRLQTTWMGTGYCKRQSSLCCYDLLRLSPLFCDLSNFGHFPLDCMYSGCVWFKCTCSLSPYMYSGFQYDYLKNENTINFARSCHLKQMGFSKKVKTTASSIPAWSPTAVLTGPFHAWLPRSDESGYFHERMAVAIMAWFYNNLYISFDTL